MLKSFSCFLNELQRLHIASGILGEVSLVVADIEKALQMQNI